MCTRVLWPDANGLVIVGRNMDFRNDTLTNLWVQPRGLERQNGTNGELTWVSTHGSVIATAYDSVPVDGLNQAGLAGHVLWLTESDYGTPDPKRPQLSQGIWLQYFLDHFTTVAEAVEWVRKSDVQVVEVADPTGGKQPKFHLALNDATGDSAIIEYERGEPQVYHSRDYLVMTNSPPYNVQLDLVTEWDGLGGDKPLPGSTDAVDRFARASYYVKRLEQPKTELEAMAAMFSIMHNAAQPFRHPDPGKPDASQTIWTTVSDLTNRRYAFESTTRPNIVWVDLDKLDFAMGAPELKLDLHSKLALEGGIAGQVSGQFADHGPLEILGMHNLPTGALRAHDLLAAARKAEEEVEDGAIVEKIVDGMD